MLKFRLRLFILLAVLLGPRVILAWDTDPHQKITRAALDSLPADVRQRFGEDTRALVEIYCIYPDRFQEMEQFGFVRKAPGPRSAGEIRVYCMRPTGELIHGITGDTEEDMASLLFLFERIAASLSARKPDEAARYAGVLSHFVADSLSPPHTVDAGRLRRMTPWFASCPGVERLHSALERSLPALDLRGRSPQKLGATPAASAQAVLASCYAGAGANRKDLPAMVKAACSDDSRKLDALRAGAGSSAAAILADALFTAAAR